MMKIVEVSIAIVGVIGLAGCAGSEHGGSGVRSTTAPTSHTAANTLACADVDIFYTDPSSVTPAKARTLVNDSLLADNPELRHEAQSLQAALNTKNSSDAQDAIDAMIGTCNRMGIGPKK